MTQLEAEVQQWHDYETAPRRPLGTWIGSTLLHGSLLIVLAISITSEPTGVVEEPLRTTGIVLKTKTPEGERFDGPNDNIAQAAESADNTSTTAVVEALPSEEQSLDDLSEWLPSQELGIGPVTGNPAAGGGVVEIGNEGPGRVNLEGGRARTGVFGITGEGFKFVYVFDSSASMSAYEGRPLRAAKRELVSSLGSLKRTHQFQIIFYNESPTIFTPTGARGGLVFATELNKKSARDYVDGIQAQANTQHEPALMIAVRMQPDVIFFLTDGEDPVLSIAQRRRIQRANRTGAIIHVIQFGDTATASRDNWLKQLARDNGGEHTFFNIRQLSP